MIGSKTATFYWLESIPVARHLPHGDETYNALSEGHTLDRLDDLINKELSMLAGSLQKYDRPANLGAYEGMCTEMKRLRDFLQLAQEKVNVLMKEISK